MNHPILDHHVLVNNIYIVDGIGPVRKDDDINVFSWAAGEAPISEGCSRGESVEEDIAFQSIRVQSLPLESGIGRDKYSDSRGVG